MEGFTTVEVWVCVDEDGSYVAHTDKDALEERYEEEVGRTSGAATRVVKVTLNVPTPKPVELAATVSAEPETGELVAK
jgi:hypothetical protein